MKDFRTWSADRLNHLARELAEVADLAQVGEDGKKRLRAAIEYIEALAWDRTANAYRKERAGELRRRSSIAEPNDPRVCSKCRSPWIEVAGLFTHGFACGGQPVEVRT